MTVERSVVPLRPAAEPPTAADPGTPLTVGAAEVEAPGHVSSLTLSGTPSATTAARHWVTTELERHGMQSADVCEDAELIVSELVSNAVLHGLAPIVVTLVDKPAELLVSVADAGEPPDRLDLRPADPTASHGRGLAIVAAVAVRWGITDHHPAPGKTVWGLLRSPVGAGPG